MKIKQQLYIAGVIAGLFIILSELGVFTALNFRSVNLFRSAHQPHPDIVLLAIDNKSLQAIGRFPWDRKVYADVLAKLQSAKPRLVAFDINFPETQNFESDQAFKTSLDQAQFPVVLATQAVFVEGQQEPQRFVLPLSYFFEQPNVTLGHVNLTKTSDGLAIFFPQALSAENRQVKPLSLEIASRVSNNSAGESTLQTDRLIDFAGPSGTFPTYSVSDLLNDQLPSGALDNKIIFLGPTASDLHDTVLVPVAGNVMAGTEWHANILDNVLLNRGIEVLPVRYAELVGLLLGLILVGIFIFLKTSIKTNITLTLIALVLLPLGSFVMWRAGFALFYLSNVIFITILFIANSFYQWYQTEAEKRQLKRTMQFYFSPSVLNHILKNPDQLKLGGERREVTILFSDIRGFTTITESAEPAILSAILQEYFTEMSEEIFATDGVVEKFIGDAIMAFWGAPLTQADKVDRAVTAALGMMKRLKELQERWAAKNWPFVDIGVGINTGLAMVGNTGSAKRFEYTAIGDTTNVASRLEGLNKEFKTHIIISESTKAQLTIPANLRELGPAQVKGRHEPINIFEVLP